MDMEVGPRFRHSVPVVASDQRERSDLTVLKGTKNGGIASVVMLPHNDVGRKLSRRQAGGKDNATLAPDGVCLEPVASDKWEIISSR